MTALSVNLPVKGLESRDRIVVSSDEFALRLRGHLLFN
jgi:hypothetical protein